jgi:hypothetical protein
MEDRFTTITINIPETPVGNRIRRIKELVENTDELIIRAVKLTNKVATWKGGIVIQPKDRLDSWLIMIEPYKNRVVLKDYGGIPFDNKSEVVVLKQIIKYYHDLARGI